MIKQTIEFELIKNNSTNYQAWKNSNIATMFSQCLHIFKLFIRIFKWLVN